MVGNAYIVPFYQTDMLQYFHATISWSVILAHAGSQMRSTFTATNLIQSHLSQ